MDRTYTQVLERVRAAARSFQGRHIVVAVSAGPDSTALALLLSDLQAEMGWRLTLAHLHHGVRARFADDDAARAGALARRLGVDIVIGRLPTAARASEAVLREARYAFLRRVRAQVGASLIALGHHDHDQAETLLMQLVRGSGLDGLAAMRPLSGDLWRPLLQETQASLDAVVAAAAFSPAHDAANEDTSYARVRFREDFLPWLEAERPGATLRLVHTAHALSEERQYLHEQALTWYRRTITHGPAGSLQVAGELAKAPAAMRLRVLAQALRALRMPPERRMLMQLDALLAEPGSPLSLPQRGRALRARTGLYLLPKMTEPAALSVDGPMRLALWDGMAMEARQEPSAGALPVSLAGGPLTVRTWRAGDRALSGVKMKDYFDDLRLDWLERRRLPLVCDNQGRVVQTALAGNFGGESVEPRIWLAWRLRRVPASL